MIDETHHGDASELYFGISTTTILVASDKLLDMVIFSDLRMAFSDTTRQDWA